MRSHKSPTDDQLGELQSANPAAFALVKSLLSKHAQHQQLAAEDRGPDVFRRMMTPRHLAAAQPSYYAAASAPIDQANYKPQAAADKDESTVDRLLNAVAAMGGEKGKKIALLRQRRHKGQQEENALTQDADLFGAPPTPAPVRAVEAAVEQVQQEQVQEQATPAPKEHENSYLKGIDLTGDMPEVTNGNHKKQHVSQGADLQSFSFDDVAPPAPKPTPAPKVEAPKPKDNAFLKYLGFVKKAPAPQEEKPRDRKSVV